jgi:hypothetical protein
VPDHAIHDYVISAFFNDFSFSYHALMPVIAKVLSPAGRLVYFDAIEDAIEIAELAAFADEDILFLEESATLFAQ